MRERAGLTAREAGELLGTGPIQISHIEAGRIGVSEERLRRLAGYYHCSDMALTDALVALATERVRGWWEEYRGALTPMSLDLAALEWHARSMQTVQVVYVPGLLQVEPYTRALFTHTDSAFSADHLEAAVNFRMQRREVLNRADPPTYTAIIHEAALRMKVGGRRVAREQLEYILERAELRDVTVRVIPFSMEGYVGMGDSMLYLAGQLPLLDTVHIDQAHGGAFFDVEAQLGRYRARFRAAEHSSHSPSQSHDFIRRILREL